MGGKKEKKKEEEEEEKKEGDRYEWKFQVTYRHFRRHWLAIQVWIANGNNEVSLVPTFLKLISWSRAIGWLMMLVKITNIGTVPPGSVKKISLLTILGQE